MKKRILIVDDEPGITIGLSDQLLMEGFEVETRGDGESGLAAVLEWKPDLVVLDLMMPKMDGLEVCKEVRRRSLDIAIIILSARGHEIDKVVGLELGADDYVTKPFAVRETVARIRAVLRRTGRSDVNSQIESLEFDDVEIDFGSFEARRGTEPVKMTPREFRILQLFAARPSQVISREEFLNQAWGEDVYVTSRTVDNQIWNLRKKLEIDPEHPAYIVSVRGAGYKFLPEGQDR